MGYWDDGRYAGADRNRRRRFDERRMTLTMDTEDDEGNEIEVSVRAKLGLCPTCEGRGTHVNPSIDDNGISAEDFDEDPDFREGYFQGRYDVPCYECGGLRVVPVPDEDDPNAAEYLKLERERAQWDAEDRRARAMGY